jgi:hypothetical protein
MAGYGIVKYIEKTAGTLAVKVTDFQYFTHTLFNHYMKLFD